MAWRCILTKKIDYNGNKNIVSKQLRLARIKAGLTQGEVAAKMQTKNINIDQQMISKIEKNLRMVTDYELAGFCEVLNVDGNTMLQDFRENGNI